MPYHVHNMNEVLGLNEDQARQDQDLVDHETAYNPHQKMNWVFPYVPAGPWIKDDTSRDGIFSGVANKDTTEPLGPVPTGIPFWPTDDVPLYNNLSQLLGVKVGNRYTLAVEGVINSARVNIPIDNVGLLVTVSFHINAVQVAETTYVPRVEGMHIYNIAPSFVFPGDVVDIEIDTVKQTGNTQVHYLEAPAYWATYSDPMFSSVQGLFDEVPDTNAYEIDMEFQPADVSEDWDILAVSSATLAPDNNPINTRETIWVQTSTDNLTKSTVSTNNNVWTEITRYAPADLSAVRATTWITATRSDTPFRAFYYESRALIYRDGATSLQTQEICEFAPHPNVTVRSTVVGTEVVIEVKGRTAQDWTWEIVYFVRDIT